MKSFKNIFKLSLLGITILTILLYVCHVHCLGLGEFLWVALIGALLWVCSKTNFSNISEKLNKFLDED